MRPGLWDDVIDRDAMALFEWLEVAIPFQRWRPQHSVICVVPMLEPTNRWPCGGKQTVDHVKDEPMMGKRAPDDMNHLVAMCEVHNVWKPPSKQLRQAERRYLGLT